MKKLSLLTVFMMFYAMLGLSAVAQAQTAAPTEVAGVACSSPPPAKCPDEGCPAEMVVEQGPMLNPNTDRNYFLDYPCDLKPGEKVTFILSLHGGGSYGNWQRHYFPLIDYIDEYRLVVATPNAPPRVWAQTDDAHLQDIVNTVYEAFGEDNIEAFWLAGHSQGGMTSYRIVCSDFFKDKVDGLLSLSGGRIGGTVPLEGGFFGSGSRPAAASGDGAPARRPARATPACDFSHIYTTGEYEMGGPIPETSEWATKYNCQQRVREEDVVDTRPGYVYDSTRQDPGTKAWGHLPRPGTAQVQVFTGCDDGRVVADVVRIDKGHTEGLEPNVTEKLVQLILAAKN